jgi:ASCH domain
MLLGFKNRFASLICAGLKTHTIRAKRKIRPRVGEIIYCYTGLRTKQAMALGCWPCVGVQDITIEPHSHRVLLIKIDGVELQPDEALEFARRDGFRGPNPLVEMQNFWVSTHGASAFPFHGDLIHWAWPGPETDNK